MHTINKPNHEMKFAWLDYILSFVFASFGRFAHDWYFASKRGTPLPRVKLWSATLYSGVTGLAITFILGYWKPELAGSPLIVGVSLLAGIGAVDLADLIHSAFKQWARKAAGLEDSDDESGK